MTTSGILVPTSLAGAGTGAVQQRQKELQEKLRKKEEEIARIRSDKEKLEREVKSLNLHNKRIQRLQTEIQSKKNEMDDLKQRKERNERELKAKINEQDRMMKSLQKQSLQKTNEISNLKHDRTKTDALLRAAINRNQQLSNKLKEEKRHAVLQQRERDRYSKEEQRRMAWLESQLAKSSQKEAQIDRLKVQLEKQQQTVRELQKKLKKKDELQAMRAQRYAKMITSSSSSSSAAPAPTPTPSAVTNTATGRTPLQGNLPSSSSSSSMVMMTTTSANAATVLKKSGLLRMYSFECNDDDGQ